MFCLRFSVVIGMMRGDRATGLTSCLEGVLQVGELPGLGALSAGISAIHG
jgi:hypothetical protein